MSATISPTAARRARREQLGRICPDGVLWIDSSGLPHPEAKRSAQLPFIFAIGRVGPRGQRHTVREAELVAEAIDPADEARLAEQLTDYARFVVASAPSQHARLIGRTLLAWQERGR